MKSRRSFFVEILVQVLIIQSEDRGGCQDPKCSHIHTT
jgi:hypothetical protein